MGPRSVVVVGGGASGVLTAIALLRRPGFRASVTLMERGSQCGRGVAYARSCARHLLNVPAGRMSALPDLPGHFADWAGAAPASFLPPRVYGEYLEAVLADAAARSAAPLHRVTGEAVAVTGGDVLLADGHVVSGAAVVLALGVGRPAPLRLEGGEPEGDRYVGDP